MQHIGQPDRGEGRQFELERRQQVRLAERRFEARQPPLGTRKTVPVDVEQDQVLEVRSARAVKKVAGA
jgi:hypothetical protein